MNARRAAGNTLDEQDRELLEHARAARTRAYAPYSRFQVGAAVRTVGGVVYPGCNVENATNGLTLCAERVAVFTALSSGEDPIHSVAVVVPDGVDARPCGICLEMFHELAPDVRLILGDGAGGARIRSLRDLLPEADGGAS